jgi:hypothetical protein
MSNGMILAGSLSMKKYLPVLFTFFVLIVSSFSAQAQDELYKASKLALKTGDAKTLATYFGNMVKIKINEEESHYSKSQAEFIIKDFFKKYPATDYQILHQGATKEGNLHYTVGKYTSKSGTFSVYMRVKMSNGQYVIDTIDFSNDKDE